MNRKKSDANHKSDVYESHYSETLVFPPNDQNFYF